MIAVISLTLVETKSTPPNIVIFLADDLGKCLHSWWRICIINRLMEIVGYNDVSWHNSHILTPNLEELAKTGLLLENAYMQPMCTASRSALLSGYYPIHTGRQVCNILNFFCLIFHTWSDFHGYHNRITYWRVRSQPDSTQISPCFPKGFSIWDTTPTSLAS